MSNIKNNNNLIKSHKSQSPEENEQIDVILVDQPEHLDDALIKKDINNSPENEEKDNKKFEKEKNEKILIGHNVILNGNRMNNDPFYFNSNIDIDLNNNIKDSKTTEKKNERKNNAEKSISDRKSKKYFDDINSSIVKKEESNFDYNTNKKSQNSDSAIFKIMNEIGNKNSVSKFKTLESLDKLNPFSSINSQNAGLLNKHEENKNKILQSIMEPEIEEEEKSNEENIPKNKLKKNLSEDIDFNIPANENKDKNTAISKDIFSNSNNDLNEACIKTNENLKSKMETSDFIQNPENNIKSDSKSSMNKINIEILLKKQSKNKEDFIEETKKEIINEINNVYNNNKLNLVKINNHEMYNFIADYNDISKDKLDYDPEYYILNNKDNNFYSRRSNFLAHNYFSYLINEKPNNNLDNKIKKHIKNYNDKIPKIEINDSSLKHSTGSNKNNKIFKISDIGNISSFFYNFCLYSPENKNKKILEENSENEIINTFTSYRKIYNDGNSFQRCCIYLLLETFLIKNQINKFNYIIYDIKKTLSQKYLDIDNNIKILIDISESYSIDNLMNSFNNLNNNFDEVMISYIEDIINKINKVDSINKRKYQEINLDYLNTLSNIFEVNLEIFYIEENKTKKNNYLLSMNKIDIFCNSFKNLKKNIKESLNDSDDSQNIPTFHLLYFINSFHIVYTKACDIDSTLADNEFTLQHYNIPSLPKINCPKCNKNPTLDIIPGYEAIICHKCLTNYMKDIIKNRVISFIKSNFSSIEYFTRPITIKPDIKITFTLYKYITGNYLIQDFETFLENTCFICYKFYNNKNNTKIIKLKCQCQLCQKCVEEKIKENMGDYKYLNLYEMNNNHFGKCPCNNIYNLNELMNYSKYKPTEKDKKDALQRLVIVLEGKCCICLKQKSAEDYIRLEIENSKPHFICINCNPPNLSDKEAKQNNNKKYKNNIKGDKNQYHDLESSNSSLRDNEKDKKFFCNICITEHIIKTDNDNYHKKEKNKIQKTVSKCCKNCSIF